MTKTKQQPLSALLQEIQLRVNAEPLSTDEQRALVQLVTSLL